MNSNILIKAALQAGSENQATAQNQNLTIPAARRPLPRSNSMHLIRYLP
jgi:hypothetical protein